MTTKARQAAVETKAEVTAGTTTPAPTVETKTEDTAADATTPTPATQAAVEDTAPEAAEKPPGECVVDDGTPHMGRAVNGKVCSAHAMHYKADGTRR